MRIAVLICENGLGHFQRAVRVLWHWLGARPDIELTVLCAAWQIERTRETAATQWLTSRATLHLDLLQPGVGWAATPEQRRAAWTDGRLLAWEQRVADSGALRQADRVLSDNLAGILSLRPDAALMGSFLWSDVLQADAPDVPQVHEFVAHERHLLAAYRPWSLSSSLLAMPGLRAQTRTVPLGWLCDETAAGAPARTSATPVSGRPCVAFLGGATGAVDGLMATAAQRALGAGWDVRVPQALAAQVGVGVGIFQFGLSAYAECAVVVCRPGVGTLTECVASALPMVLIDEGSNVEMDHNTATMVDSGLALAPSELGVTALMDTIERALAPETQIALRARLHATPKDGLAQAARWLDDWTSSVPRAVPK